MKSDSVNSDRKFKIAAVLFGFLLFSGFMTMLYIKDSKTVQDAIVVRAFFVNFCMENTRYPKYEEFEKKFPKLAQDPDWFYWPADDLRNGTFQYPMTLPLSSAPGRSKFSEFMPIIYSYAVSNPCQVFSRELL